MKIAIIGIRGIPVVYSGFETFSQELSTRLVKKGHQVTVYCRSAYVKNRKSYKGVKLHILPAIRRKNWETFSHSFLSVLHALFLARVDIIYFLGVGNAIFSIFPRILGIKTIVNVDGIDWQRKKWGFVAKQYLRFNQKLATLLPNQTIADSIYMKQYYLKNYGKQLHYIPYGYSKFDCHQSDGALKKYGVVKKQYLIWSGRLVPDNNLEELLKSFRKLKYNLKCLIVGDDYYESKYKKQIKKYSHKDKRIIFTGFVNRQEYACLLKESLAYVETKRSGGSHPSLIEAMGCSCLIIANDHPATKELLGPSGLYYQRKNAVESLSQLLKYLTTNNLDKKKRFLKLAAKKRAQQLFRWEKIVHRYQQLFAEIATK